ncbi:hypothetical protein HPB50_009343 [Hyalomma asiaticum]|uniref:Uncharacterized protein n=1 Tax=Hyalomma asiaticum TaxID=266040 RepID=A0ACB7T1S6_HYAAI|nr:hypothetical protein HPB50_009343 [Hyalomma asiaticum]
MASPRLMLGWTVVRAAEDLHVPLCTFCASYGHGRSTCPVAAEASRAMCTGGTAECWAVCPRAGMEAAGHAAGSHGCPLLRDRVARMRARTDYGET